MPTPRVIVEFPRFVENCYDYLLSTGATTCDLEVDYKLYEEFFPWMVRKFAATLPTDPLIPRRLCSFT